MTDLDLIFQVLMAVSGRTQTRVVPRRTPAGEGGKVTIRITGVNGKRGADEIIREAGTRIATAKTFRAVTPAGQYWIVHSDELRRMAHAYADQFRWLVGNQLMRPRLDYGNRIGRETVDILLAFTEAEWTGAESTTWELEWEVVQDWKPRGGGQGTVRKVKRRSDGVVGALKVLREEALQDSTRRYRMHRETESLRFMDGVGVPAVLDSNTSEYRLKGLPLYVVTRFVEGPTVAEFVARNGPLSISDAIAVARRIADTLERLHAGGTHRDLKPDNVILEGRDPSRVVVVDFGMASANDVSQDDFETSGDQELGNRFLRLPEFGSGRHDWDSRSDITFLVGLLFFLTTAIAPRALQDARARAPHELLDERREAKLARDPLWDRLRRFVFAVGFEHRIDYRFQNLAQLRAALDRVCASADEQKPAEGLERLRTVMTSREAQERDALRAVMLRASAQFIAAIQDGLKPTGCSAAGKRSKYVGR